VRRPEEVLVVVWRPGEKGPEFLVLERSPKRQGYWHLVAGALDGGESWEEAAARELQEETGLAAPVEDLGLRFSYPVADEPPEKVARLPAGVAEIAVAGFAAEAPAGWEPTLDDEHVAHRWLPAWSAAELLRYHEPRDAVRAVAQRLERA
jgi:8-oxo-dGTP pyrophosphatase MutT (NUDIX family)